MPSVTERLMRLETEFATLSHDVSESNVKLDALTVAVQGFTDAQKVARQSESDQYDRLQRRIALLTLVVAIVGLAVPLIVTFLHQH